MLDWSVLNIRGWQGNLPVPFGFGSTHLEELPFLFPGIHLTGNRFQVSRGRKWKQPTSPSHKLSCHLPAGGRQRGKHKASLPSTESCKLPKRFLQLTYQNLLRKPKLSLNMGTATRQSSHYLQQPHAEGLAGPGLSWYIISGIHCWVSHSLCLVQCQSCFSNPAWPTSCWGQTSKAHIHPERRQDQWTAGEWTD